MKKLLLIVVVGMLTACGSDAGEEVQTYQSLIEAAKSDPVALSKQINNGVEMIVNPSLFTGEVINDNYILMKGEQDNNMQYASAFSLSFPKSDKVKINQSPEFVAVCKNNNLETGFGIYIDLNDCTIK